MPAHLWWGFWWGPRRHPVLDLKVLTAAGVEDYYADAVISGVEDYYLGGDAPAGLWCASSERLLGLSGTVGRDQLTAVRDDQDPERQTRLGLSNNRRVRGFDLSFRAPKSVSIAWAFADAATATTIIAAHSE